ncbi:MAG TPA: response regulator, partial [Epsilonproteobacteria bacterium]|nr:response regulator [Campylobacterota bacterium]
KRTDDSSLNLALELVDWINKPIDKDKLVASLSKAIELQAHKKPAILHVEDDKDVAHIVKTMLSDIGNVDIVADLESALKKIQSNSYDLIILDMMLPDGSGEEVLQAVKEREDDIPVLIFSAIDVDNRLKSEVKKALLKSRTSNTELVDNIKKILHNKGAL